jgi:RpiB/LacA/LacB family sugar-phosphate isomerase
MKIALASDHAGYELKTGIAAYLGSRGVPFEDFGCGPGESVDYVDYGAKAARAVVSGVCDRAILVCGTGIGMAIAANKIPGIRAAVVWNEASATLGRAHNDANIMAIGGRTTEAGSVEGMLRAFLSTEYEGGRHDARLAKIARLERKDT